MKNISLMMMMAFLLAFTACEEDVETFGRGDKTMTVRPGGPGDKVVVPGELPYPKIIRRTYIPEYDLFSDTRCNAIRIEWPAYEEGVDPEMIPDLLTTATQSLYSFNYAKSDPVIKASLDFSLYHENKLQTPYNTPGLYPLGGYTGEFPKFVKHNIGKETIEHWVTERPGHFESYYKNSKEPKTDEVDYQAGDFFLMYLDKKNLYGGVRIVSESPRIIEVYIAEQNI